MSNNVTANPGSGGATFSTIDKTAAGNGQAPVTMLDIGSGTTQTLVGTSNPLPVDLSHTSANSTAIKVDGSAVTQPVSAASLPLPSGAATAAKQPALGTAGSASADVLSVQGIASMTALKVDGSAVTQPVSDGGGSLTVDGTVAATQSGTWNVGTVTTITNVVHVDDNAGSLTVDGTVTATLSSSTNAGATAKTLDYDTGAGTDTVTAFGLLLPASGGSVAGGTATNPIQVSVANTGANSTAVKVDGSAVTQPVSIAGTVTVNNAGQDQPVAQVIGTLFNGTTSTSVLYSKISCASSGDNTLISGSASKKITVIALFLTVNGTAVSIYFRDAAAGTAIFADGTNSIPLDKTGATGAAGFSLGFNPGGWMQTSAGNALVLNLSAAQGVCGGITYTQV